MKKKALVEVEAVFNELKCNDECAYLDLTWDFEPDKGQIVMLNICILFNTACDGGRCQQCVDAFGEGDESDE